MKLSDLLFCVLLLLFGLTSCAAIKKRCSVHSADSTEVISIDTARTAVRIDTITANDSTTEITEIHFSPGADVKITAEGDVKGKVTSYKKTKKAKRHLSAGSSSADVMQMHYNSSAIVKHKDEEISVQKKKRPFGICVVLSVSLAFLILLIYLKRIPILERIRKFLKAIRNSI